LDFLGEVTVAPITSTVRDIPSEVFISKKDGLPWSVMPEPLFACTLDPLSYSLHQIKPALAGSSCCRKMISGFHLEKEELLLPLP
jgi:hypothetical protein